MKTIKTVKITLAALILILFILIGITYYYSSKTCVNEIDNSIISISIDNDNNVYTNKQEGYIIELERDWSLDPYLGPKTISFLDSRAMALSAKDSGLTAGMKISILSYPLSNNENADRYIQGKITESRPYLIDQKEISIDGHMVQQITENALGYQIATFIPKDNSVITIVGYIAEQEQHDSYTEIYDDIIRTFEFID